MSKYLNLKWVSMKSGFNMGCKMPLLPYNMYLMYNVLLISILSVLGGMSVIMYMMEYYLYLNSLGYMIVCFAMIHTTHIIIVFMIKIMYSFWVFKSIEIFHKDFVMYKLVMYLTLVFSVIILMIMEYIGFLGFEISQYIELCNHMHDVKNSYKSMNNK